jgi:chemotaxis signal transduction protein
MPMFVVYETASRRFALPARDVVQVLRMVAIARLPGAPPHVRGVVDLHGTPVPVVDVSVLVGEPPREPDPSQQLLLVQAVGRLVALQVDRVVELREGPLQDARAAGLDPSLVAGAASLPGGLVLVPDLARWLEGASGAAVAAGA